MESRYLTKHASFKVRIGLLPLILIVSSKESLLLKSYDKSVIMETKIFNKTYSFKVRIGVLPLILIVSSKELLLLKSYENLSSRNQR